MARRYGVGRYGVGRYSAAVTPAKPVLQSRTVTRGTVAVQRTIQPRLRSTYAAVVMLRMYRAFTITTFTRAAASVRTPAPVVVKDARARIVTATITSAAITFLWYAPPNDMRDRWVRQSAPGDTWVRLTKAGAGGQ